MEMPEQRKECPRFMLGDSQVPLHVIQETIAKHYQVPSEEIMSRSRLLRIAWARQVAMVMAMQLRFASCREAGIAFGRDHGTASHARRTVRAAIECYPAVRDDIEALRKKILLAAAKAQSRPAEATRE